LSGVGAVNTYIKVNALTIIVLLGQGYTQTLAGYWSSRSAS